jgi:hypothetical protein
MEEPGDFPSWCAAAVERVPTAEAERVPHFATAVRCYRTWCALAGTGIPARQQLDPMRFGAELLPHLSLIDAVDGGRDYRWRLCGEQVFTVLGMRVGGRLISGIEAELGEAVLFREALDEVVADRAPLFYVLRHQTVAGCMKRSYGVLLPLTAGLRPQAPPPGPVAHILGAFDWTSGA